MRADIIDTLGLMSRECERADLPPGLQGILVKVLALVPQAYMAGWQDREAEGVIPNGGGA